MITRRTAIASLGAAVLAACGFELKRAPVLPFDKLALQGFRADSPLGLELRLAPDDVALAQQALSQLIGVSSVITEDGLRVSCPRASKMAVLGALAGLGAKVLDLNIREPSLEDVFFGFSD